jgi:hypothetical protein
MPFVTADVEGHKAGLSTAQKALWVRVANGALTACEEAGKSDCEGSAIRQANTVAGGMREAGCVIGEDGAITFEEARQEESGPITRAIERLGKLISDRLQEQAPPELISDIIPLKEASVRGDGTLSVKIIEPGWGSAAFYPAEVLERDGPKAFPKGTHMFLDHPTESEDKQRPERSVRDLVGALTGDARWMAEGPAGPGLYGDAEVIAPFRDALDELAPHIGVSIRAMGEASEGEREGRKGPVLERFDSGISVDFVTAAGAGGKVLELMESARARILDHKKGDPQMSEQELKKALGRAEAAEKERDELKEAQTKQGTELARLQEGAVLREAREIVTEVLAKVEHLPELTQARLEESLSAKPPTKDGALDKDALGTAIEEATKAEIEYLAKLTESGSIKGLGGSVGAGDEEKADKELEESFRRLGATESGAKIAVAGRS